MNVFKTLFNNKIFVIFHVVIEFLIIKIDFVCSYFLLHLCVLFINQICNYHHVISRRTFSIFHVELNTNNRSYYLVIVSRNSLKKINFLGKYSWSCLYECRKT